MFALALVLLLSAAHADLYRWIDPESGSVKISNTPPPWFERSAGPPVEVIRSTVPAKPAATQPAASPPTGSPQARWRDMLLAVSSQPTKEGLQALINLATELDRVDPAGAAQRRGELAGLVQKGQR